MIYPTLQCHWVNTLYSSVVLADFILAEQLNEHMIDTSLIKFRSLTQHKIDKSQLCANTHTTCVSEQHNMIVRRQRLSDIDDARES